MKRRRRHTLLTLAVVLVAAALISISLRPARLPVHGILYQGLRPGTPISEVTSRLGHFVDENRFRRDDVVWSNRYGSAFVGFQNGECVYLDDLSKIELETPQGPTTLVNSMGPDEVVKTLGEPDATIGDSEEWIGIYDYPDCDLRLEVYRRFPELEQPFYIHFSHFRVSRLSEPKARSFAVETAAEQAQSQ
jgi:hypothetical protein